MAPKKKTKPFYVFDFENRNTVENQATLTTSIWLWDICDENLNHVHGTTIESFLDYIKALSPATFYSHNLKYDASFILSYWLKHGWKFVDRLEKNKQFTALCDDLGRLYFLKARVINPTVKRGNSLRNIGFRDSAKKIDGSVEEIALSYNLPIKKGSIDHNKIRGPRYQPDDNEIEYIEHDTEIIMTVLLRQYQGGLNRLTTAGDSFNAYLESVGRGSFRDYFPILPLEIDKICREAWFGGYVIAADKYKGKILNDVYAYDYNSKYAAIMCYKVLPYGEPVPFKGKPKPTELYPLYIIHFKACFKIKERRFPHIQSKNSFFTKVEYISDTGIELKELYLTRPDFELFLEDYEVFDIKYLDGLYFHGSDNLFKDYLLPLYEAKNNSNSGSERENAKKLLTGLYGKFGTTPRHITRKPVLNEDGVLKWILYKDEIGDPVYTAMAAFICAYGHVDIIKDMNAHYDIVAYGDTDSIHTVGPAPGFVLSKNLGGFKIEHHFKEVKYLGSKAYYGIEEDESKPLIKCSGLPATAKAGLTIDDFEIGHKFEGKLHSVAVAGGTILAPTVFTIKER